MAESPSGFTRDWIAEHVRNDPTFDGDVPVRTAAILASLKRDAKAAGLDMTDPELNDDLLTDEISAAIESTYDPMAGGFKD